MTSIFYPDVSHYDRDRGVTIAPGTVAVIAKATHGAAFVDPAFASFRQQAASVGAVFAGYHWLNHGNVAAQAAFYHAHGGTTPCMIDAEDMPGNTGYNGPLTVADVVGFAQELRALGGVCNLAYLPHWYWDQHMGGPSLQPLKDIGLGLVSSNYTAYSDTGPGWDVYRRDNGAVEPSGMRPVAWQYTDALPYGGSTSDFNAFKGTLDEFRALIAGGTDVNLSDGIDIPNYDGDPALPAIEHSNVGRALGVASQRSYQALQTARRVEQLVGDLAGKVTTMQAPAAPTQEQVDAAVLKALSDPAVAKGIGDAVAAHLHVN